MCIWTQDGFRAWGAARQGTGKPSELWVKNANLHTLLLLIVAQSQNSKEAFHKQHARSSILSIRPDIISLCYDSQRHPPTWLTTAPGVQGILVKLWTFKELSCCRSLTLAMYEDRLWEAPLSFPHPVPDEALLWVVPPPQVALASKQREDERNPILFQALAFSHS